MSKTYKMKSCEIVMINGKKEEEMRKIFDYKYPLTYWVLEETAFGLALHTSNNRILVRVFEANEQGYKKYYNNPEYCLLRIPAGYYFCETVVYATVRKIIE